MSQPYIPPHKRKRVDSLEPEAPKTNTAEVSSKKLKLSTKLSTRTTTSSPCTTAWGSGPTKPCSSSSTSQSSWCPGAAKHLFPSSTPHPIIRGPSPSSTSQSSWGQGASKHLFISSTSQPTTRGPSPSSYTTSELPALRSESLTSSNSSASSQSSTSSQSSVSSVSHNNAGNWRSSMGASKPKPIAIGQVCWLPKLASDVPAGEPILQHPDFKHGGGFDHPCLIIEGPDNKGYLKCFQATSFSGYPGGLETKYVGPRQIGQRNRWLLVEHAVQANHDNLPVLEYDTREHLHKASYINTEKYFKIKAEHLIIPSGKPIKLTMDSVDTAKQHHYTHFHALKQTIDIR